MLEVGANPRVASAPKTSNILSGGDLRTYRTLLTQSHELGGGDREDASHEDGSPEVVRLAQVE
jgi:hypothetical protein